MKTASVPQSYARALFNLANKANELDLISNNIHDLGALCKKMHEIFVAIDKQAPISKKRDFIAVLMSYGKLHDVTKKFLELLRLENKLSLLFDISQSFADLYRSNKNIVVAKIRSVKKLDKSADTKLQKFLNDLLQKEVTIDNIIDQAIMGGIVIEVGSYIIDNSFVNRMRRLNLAVDKR